MEAQTEERGGTGDLFRNDDLVVRRVGGFSTERCVVTFDSFTDHRTLDRPGFGEGFFRAREIDAIHVIARENDWYQYAGMADAMAAVAAVTAGYQRVVTYGSSMGAYAAIRLAGLAGAHCALALSPQFSIDPAIVPFEFRWEEPGLRFQAIWERTLPLPRLEQAYVVYDPTDPDMKQIDLFPEAFQFTHVRLPGAGHPVTGYLAELGLLDGLVQQACRGAVDVPQLEAEAWERREQSAQYFVFQAMTAKPREKKIEMLQRAVSLQPLNAVVHCRLGVQLGKAARFDEAEAAHRLSLELIPGQPNLLLHQSYTVELLGDIRRALAIMEEALAQSGGASLYVARTAWLRAQVEGKRVPQPHWLKNWWARMLGRGHGRSISTGR